MARRKKAKSLEEPLRLTKGGECWLKGIGFAIHGPYLVLEMDDSDITIAMHYHSSNGKDVLSQLGPIVVVDERQLVLTTQKPLKFKGTQGYTDYRGQYIPPTHLEWFITEYASEHLNRIGGPQRLDGEHALCLLSDRWRVSY